MPAELFKDVEQYFLQKINQADLIDASFTVFSGIKSIAERIKLIRERSYNKRLYTFLTETNKTTDQQRLEFLEDLKEDHDEFWEKVVSQLDQIDDEEKAKVSGKLAEALILKFVDRDMLHRLYFIIRNTYIADLTFFCKKYKTPNPGDGKFVADIDVDMKYVLERLVNSGLLQKAEKGLMVLDTQSSQLEYSPTNMGKVLLKYGF